MVFSYWTDARRATKVIPWFRPSRGKHSAQKLTSIKEAKRILLGSKAKLYRILN